MGILISCLSNLRYVAWTISLETPLKVLGQNIRFAYSGASEPNFKSGISGQFFAPDEATQSGVSCDSSRCDDDIILPELDSYSIFGVRCQVQEEVNSITTLRTKLGERFSDVGNREGCSISREVVRNSLHVVKSCDLSVS